MCAGVPLCGQPLPWLRWVVLPACPLAWALRDLLNFTPNSVFLLCQILLTGLVRSRGPGCLNLPVCLLFSYLQFSSPWREESLLLFSGKALSTCLTSVLDARVVMDVFELSANAQAVYEGHTLPRKTSV